MRLTAPILKMRLLGRFDSVATRSYTERWKGVDHTAGYPVREGQPEAVSRITVPMPNYCDLPGYFPIGVRPWSWTGSGGGLTVCRAQWFSLRSAQVAERRVQPRSQLNRG
jgi:hypothetical protein